MAAFNVDAFRSQLQGDLARPNLFAVMLNIPAIVVNATVAMSKVNFLARASQLPGSSLGTVPIFYFGREVKIPGNRTFPEWTIQVLNDEDFIIRKALERWMNAVNSHQGNIRTIGNTTSAPTTNASVTQYGKDGSVLKVYNFVGLWPADVAPIDVDWSANDTAEEFAVTFQYQYWTTGGQGDNDPTTT